MDKKGLFSWLRPKLRRLSYQWGERKKAQQKARVSRGKYKCAECERQGFDILHGPKDISLDHIIPVMSPEGFITFDEYIMNLFCKSDGFQVLCHKHHDEKTKIENEERKKYKKTLDIEDDI